MLYENKIYKESNLEYDDSVSTYGGWGAQQNPHAFEAFYNLLNEIKPSRILEIGTSLGGFTEFLQYSCKRLDINCYILSYDVMDRDSYSNIIKTGIDIRIEDIFSDNYQILKSEVIDFIQDSGTTLVLCDGGNKIKEFNLISNYIKVGDFIMAHDYSDDDQTFKENIYKKYWNWHEISDKDIQDACERNNLISYNKEIFDKAVWACKKKI